MKTHTHHIYFDLLFVHSLLNQGFKEMNQHYFSVSQNEITGLIRTVKDSNQWEYWLVYTHKAMGYYFPDPSYAIPNSLNTFPISINVRDFPRLLQNNKPLIYQNEFFFAPKRIVDHIQPMPTSSFIPHKFSENPSKLSLDNTDREEIEDIMSCWDQGYPLIAPQLNEDLCYKAIKDFDQGESVLADDMLFQLLSYYKVHRLPPPEILTSKTKTKLFWKGLKWI